MASAQHHFARTLLLTLVENRHQCATERHTQKISSSDLRHTYAHKTDWRQRYALGPESHGIFTAREQTTSVPRRDKDMLYFGKVLFKVTAAAVTSGNKWPPGKALVISVGRMQPRNPSAALSLNG